jgi:hypothetical protein
MEQLGSHYTDLYEIRYLRIFRKSVKEIQFLLKSDKNNWYFELRRMNIFGSISQSSS